MRLNIKTTREILKTPLRILPIDYGYNYNSKWVLIESLKENGIDIEAHIDGSNNPEMLVSGIFIPYIWLNGEQK